MMGVVNYGQWCCGVQEGLVSNLLRAATLKVGNICPAPQYNADDLTDPLNPGTSPDLESAMAGILDRNTGSPASPPKTTGMYCFRTARHSIIVEEAWNIPQAKTMVS